jgi:hypothetical protein
MTLKYDTEDLLETVLGIMTTGGALNSKIAAIEAEKISAGKGLSPTLKPVAATSYFLQSWSEGILNASPAIFYGVEDVAGTESAGPVVAKTYKLFVEVVLVDSGMSSDGSKRVMRYARALEELFAESFAPSIAYGRVKIEAVRPAAFKLALDSDDEVKVGGVSLTIGIA